MTEQDMSQSVRRVKLAEGPVGTKMLKWETVCHVWEGIVVSWEETGRWDWQGTNYLSLWWGVWICFYKYKGKT